MTSADQMLAPHNEAAAQFTVIPVPAVADPDTTGIEVVTKEVGGVIHYTAAPNYTIPEGSRRHETGHAFHYSLRRKRPDIDWMARYWAFRGFPGTWQEAETDAYTHGNPWPYLPGESWAEAFRIAWMGFGSEKTLDYGKTINPAATLAFFKSLNDEVMPVAVVDYPGAVWIPSPNYTPGRPVGVTDIVEHWTAAPANSVIATFTSPNSGVSAHYLVKRTGEIVQFVRESNRAWHDSSAGWNDKSVGIEHEHETWQTDWPVVQLEASQRLHQSIRDRYGVLVVGTGHGATYPVFTTQCPGDLPISLINEEDDLFTADDRAKLQRIYDMTNAEGPRVWTQRLQDWLSRALKSMPTYAKPTDYTGPDVTSGQPRT